MYSDLIDVALTSPNHSSRDGLTPCIVTPHHAAGICTVEGLLAEFVTPWQQGGRMASANYVIGNDGRIGGCVPEEFRAWTSDSKYNDQRAITIEVSNDVNGEPWTVGSRAFDALIRLSVDICIRYDITLWWTPSERIGSITAHKWYAATRCPGGLYDRFPEIITEVNRQVEDYKKRLADLERSVAELEEKVADLTTDVNTRDYQINELVRAVLPVYRNLDQIPKDYKSTIEKLIRDGALKGTGNSLDVPDVMARIFTILDREGVYKK